MDPQAGTSFIPKKPLEGASSSISGGSVGLLMALALLVFVASVASAGAAFLYQRFLVSSIASKTESLRLAEAAFEPATINELIRLDSRINEAESILQKHVAPSTIFAFLSTQTLEKVRYNSFTYDAKDDGSADITLKGQAESFSVVALQSDQLGASKMLKDIIFSDINVDPVTNKVAFSVKATVDPALILYSKNLQQAQPIQNQPAQNQPTQAQPAVDQPAQNQPAQDQPAVDTSSDTPQ